MRIRLGVNLDHVATLRQVRGGLTSYPDLSLFLDETVKAGADQITIHLREDRRHIQDRDVFMVCRKSKVPVNLEMAVSTKIQNIALKAKPYIVCLVPEKREELTTEGGLNVVKAKNKIKLMTRKLNKSRIRVSTFIEPSFEQVRASFEVGADAVEFHTGKWVGIKGPAQKKEWMRLKKAAVYAHSLGLQVHAGHGLDFATTKKIKNLPYLEEVNIGHFLICDALKNGLKSSIQSMKKILR